MCYVVLVEGSLSIFASEDKENKSRHVRLKPREKGTFVIANGNISKEKVDVYPYIAWVNGELVFRYMSFENILKKLERHFDIQIINHDKDLAKEKFNANFGKASLEDFLKNFSATYGITYKFEKNILFIYPKEN